MPGYNSFLSCVVKAPNLGHIYVSNRGYHYSILYYNNAQIHFDEEQLF